VDILAVGDVNVSISAANTVLDFQPAGSNVFFVTIVFSNNSYMYNLTNGTLITQQGYGVTNGAPRGFFVDNSIYLRIPAQGGSDVSGFTAIQIK